MIDAARGPQGLLLSDDLIFTSRIVGAASGAGLSLRAVRTAPELIEFARRSPPACVIVDLDNPGLKLTELMAALAELPVRARVVAYGPHVNAEQLRSARAAGCDPVLPRSKFVEQLGGDMPRWFGKDVAESGQPAP